MYQQMGKNITNIKIGL